MWLSRSRQCVQRCQATFLLDHVRITREGGDAIIDHADANLSVARIVIGPGIATMTDAEIVEMYNQILDAQWRLLQQWDETVVAKCATNGPTPDLNFDGPGTIQINRSTSRAGAAFPAPTSASMVRPKKKATESPAEGVA